MRSRRAQLKERRGDRSECRFRVPIPTGTGLCAQEEGWAALLPLRHPGWILHPFLRLQLSCVPVSARRGRVSQHRGRDFPNARAAPC